ncbi:hypothetical protein [Nocardioides convexus]|uniref:hypothetical protein n=1 Tax=Nocardioides convexus TaxID=2712224 RepID=UPI002418A9D8|nr:hypothetical protein [Nocardioides convexus]
MLLYPRRFLSWIPLVLRVMSRREHNAGESVARMTGRKVVVRAAGGVPRQLDGDTIGEGTEPEHGVHPRPGAGARPPLVEHPLDEVGDEPARPSPAPCAGCPAPRRSGSPSRRSSSARPPRSPTSCRGTPGGRPPSRSTPS